MDFCNSFNRETQKNAEYCCQEKALLQIKLYDLDFINCIDGCLYCLML